MRKFVVPQEDVEEMRASRAVAVELALQRERRRQTIQSIASALLVVGLLAGILALIVVIPWRWDISPIVTYEAPNPEREELDRPEIDQRARPNPPGMKSSRARVIASKLPAELAVPVPEDPIPEGPFGMSEEIGEGWGDGEGDGSGGGGASFFGSRRKGKRVVYVVDFSNSMGSSTERGGTRIASLKKELIRSINDLSSGMQFAVIFFSSRSWTIDTEGPNHVDNGWNGLGDPPPANWYPATEHIKRKVIKQISAMPADGGTMWYPALKQGFSMTPPPNIVYLLSDGEPRDGENVLFDLKEINPHGVPIDTIAFELPGSPAAMLNEISQNTGGKFSMVYKGKLLRGMAAEKYTSPQFD